MATEITHKILTGYVTPGSSCFGEIPIVADTEVNVGPIDLTPNTTTTVDFVATTAKLQSMALLADVACSVTGWNGDSQGSTFTLAANIPFVYWVNGPVANPFGADVTKITITPAGQVAGTFLLKSAQNLVEVAS